MFVVRVIISQDEAPNFKAFEGKDDAEHRFKGLWLRTHEGEFDSTAIFQVKATDARQAVEAVKNGDQTLVTLLDIVESEEIWSNKNIGRIEL